ncbi:MAG: endonuclease domain-containing protein [Chlamydiae bacterium]|nr:endonuclease domain-containing protein [Chlamydiota bacterium]MBI3266030.1 endonuclease domain-containing protein [Chlamydiota bacterium]
MTQELRDRARKLRHHLTEAEKYLWYSLQACQLGVKFRRQAVIGRYIVDFACFERKLIIEVDGGQHAQNQDDKERDEGLRKEGFEILRFWNHEVLKNRNGTLERIVEQLKIPLPNPPHKGGGNNRSERSLRRS